MLASGHRELRTPDRTVAHSFTGALPQVIHIGQLCIMKTTLSLAYARQLPPKGAKEGLPSDSSEPRLKDKQDTVFEET
jgi:hypothetical protein